MAFKIFLDANLILDFTLQRPGYDEALKVLKLGANATIHLYTSPAVIHVVSYYTSRTLRKQLTKRAMLLLINDVQVIDCDHGTALIAINSNFEDIEDALQYYTALKHGIDYFISADKKLKKYAIPQLPVYTASELLAELPNQ